MTRIIFALIAALVFSDPAHSQDAATPGLTSIGSVEAQGGGSSLQGTIKYQLPLDDIFLNRFDPASQRGSLFDISPDVTLNFSEGPEFNSIVIKVTGNYLRFDTTVVDGIRTPDSSKLFHAFPISLGLEADQSFDNAALIAEVGYVPFRLSPIGGNEKFKLGVNPRIGIFAQAGYKFGIDDESDTGAAADQSAEVSDSEIGRIKLSGDIEIPLFSFGQSGSSSVSILASADFWYDFVNSETYDRTEVTLRLGLDPKTNIDFKYEKGSGAPNFNEGEQFGVFLSTTF